MTYQQIWDDEDEDLGQDEASKPIRSTDDSFRVCGCMDTAADRIGFTIREGRRYVDGGMAWYVCLQGQRETGLYSTTKGLFNLHYKYTQHMPETITHKPT